MSEFEINVKQTQSGSSIKDAGNDLKAVKAQGGEAGKAVGESFEDMGRKISASQNIAAGFARALKGDLTGLIQVAQGLRGVFVGIGPAVAVAGAAVAGWKLGDMIRSKWIDPLIEGNKELVTFVGKSKESFSELANIKLEALKTEIDGIKDSLDATLGALARAEARAQKKRSAQMEEEIASVPEGEGKALAVAAIRKKYGMQEVESDQAASAARQSELEKRRAEISGKSESMRQEILAAIAEQEDVQARIRQHGSTTDLVELSKQSRNKLAGLRETYRPQLEKNDRLMAGINEDIQDEQLNQEIVPLRRKKVRNEYASASQTAAKDAQEREERKRKEDKDFQEQVGKYAIDSMKDDAADLKRDIPKARVAAQHARATGQGAEAAEQALQAMVAKFNRMTDSIINAERQMKNSNRMQ